MSPAARRTNSWALSIKSANRASFAALFATTTTSTPAGISGNDRNTSRILRRTRFRSTDLPSRPGTAIPTLDCELPFRRACTVKKSVDARRPSRYASRNCSLDLRRFTNTFHVPLKNRRRRDEAKGVPVSVSVGEGLRPSASRFSSHGQPVAPLRLSSLQNGPPSRRSHPAPKTMGPLTLACLRLVCALHHLQGLRHPTIAHAAIVPERLCLSSTVDNLRITWVVLHRFWVGDPVTIAVVMPVLRPWVCG